jgi:nitrous oxidase accessory protein NosD
MPHHHTDSIGDFDPARPEDSIRRMIDASNYSSNFRGSPAIKALEWALAEIERLRRQGTNTRTLSDGEKP